LVLGIIVRGFWFVKSNSGAQFQVIE